MSKVSCFAPYPFKAGERLNIAAGKRQGDWLVAAVNGDKVTLRCPVSGREFEWQNFCYLVTENEQPWPTGQ
ncbi:MAG: hypothetical protein ABFR97_04555 [Thermodesulfobacteriota bacterium]